MSTAWHDPQHAPITWEMFLDIDQKIRRELEIVDGYVVPREQRSREHQKVATRLSLALEAAAVQQMRKSGGAECYETNTEVDVLLWEVPPTARKPDAVLHRCIPDVEQLAAAHVLIAAEVLSTWSGRRDRVHKMSDYADAGIPHTGWSASTRSARSPSSATRWPGERAGTFTSARPTGTWARQRSASPPRSQ